MHMNGNEIALRENVLKRRFPDGVRKFLQEGIMADHIHIEGTGIARHPAANPAAADKAEALAAQHDAGEFLARPAALLHMIYRRRQLARERHQQREGQFGGGRDVAENLRVFLQRPHGNAALLKAVARNVIGSSGGTGDDLQLRGRRQHLRRELHFHGGIE